MTTPAQQLRERAGRIAEPPSLPVRQPSVQPPYESQGIIWLVVRVVTADRILAQRVDYLDDPPQVGRVQAVGPFFEVFVPHGWQNDQVAWTLFPLMDGDRVLTTADPEAMAAETLSVQFYVVKAHPYGTRWLVDVPLKMPSNVEFADPDDEMSEGMGI